MQDFVTFLREQGVIGLAVGFILGGAVSQVVQALVTDIINPLIGLALAEGGLASATVTVGGATLRWGDFVIVLINFAVVAAVVYVGVKLLKADRFDAKSDS